jgi:hypothetical protein
MPATSFPLNHSIIKNVEYSRDKKKTQQKKLTNNDSSRLTPIENPHEKTPRHRR